MSKKAKGMSPGDYEHVGRTADGVRVIKPSVAPTHFTAGEIRTLLSTVLRDRDERGAEAPPARGTAGP